MSRSISSARLHPLIGSLALICLPFTWRQILRDFAAANPTFPAAWRNYVCMDLGEADDLKPLLRSPSCATSTQWERSRRSCSPRANLGRQAQSRDLRVPGCLGDNCYATCTKIADDSSSYPVGNLNLSRPRVERARPFSYLPHLSDLPVLRKKCGPSFHRDLRVARPTRVEGQLCCVG